MNTRHPMFVPVVAIVWVASIFGSLILAPAKVAVYWHNVPDILAALLFWGVPCAIITSIATMLLLRGLGFTSLGELRREIVIENNAAAAILIIGAPLVSLVFLQWVIRP